MTKTAVLLKDRLPRFNGHAALYKLSPPISYTEYDNGEEHDRQAAYVIASSAYAMFSGPETYLFPSDEGGEVISWGELPGSSKGDISHADVLHAAGYKLVRVPA